MGGFLNGCTSRRASSFDQHIKHLDEGSARGEESGCDHERVPSTFLVHF
jgi:hypothetical protein